MKPTADTGLSRTTIKLVFLTHAVATGSLFTRRATFGLVLPTLMLAFLLAGALEPRGR